MCDQESPSGRQWGLSTLSIHGHDPDLWSWKPIALPLVTSSNFKYTNITDSVTGKHANGPKHDDDYPEYFYGRHGNPTRDCLERTVASLEGAKYGLGFSSGMTSAVACCQLLNPGDAVVCSNVCYGGVFLYLSEYATSKGIEVTFVDASESVDNVRAALKPNTKLVWMEVCTNPTLSIIDIEEVAKVVSKYSRDIILAVDNTFLTPYFLKPLALGAQIVVHSMTKYMSGHGDVVMGCLATSRKDLFEQLREIQADFGLVASPFDCYLMCRSLRTLSVRMRQHESNALVVARFLEGHHAVERVLYPGLASHPQHLLASRIMSGFSGMVTCYLKGRGIEQTPSFLKALKLITYAVSLGSTETLVCLPWNSSHGMLSEESRRAVGVTETMVRISVGIEDVEDIVQDLKQALDQLEL